MRIPAPALGLLVATALGFGACSSTTITNGTLNFTVAESILVLEPDNPTIGYVVLSQGTGLCPALQSGLTIIPPLIGNYEYLFILLGVLDASANLLPLTAGSYGIINPTDPNAPFNPPGLLANAAGVQADSSCTGSATYASTGTATISPFASTDGGSSGLNYSAVFNNTQITGQYTLTTCLVPSTTALADAGTCVLCTGGTPDGGPCVIP
jgi:hypothetical protein